MPVIFTSAFPFAKTRIESLMIPGSNESKETVLLLCITVVTMLRVASALSGYTVTARIRDSSAARVKLANKLKMKINSLMYVKTSS